MSARLNATARFTLREYGVSQAAYIRGVGYVDGKWHGDACGCPDDRCIGYHHDGPDDCECLPAVLESRPWGAAGRCAVTGRQAGSAPGVVKVRLSALLRLDEREHADPESEGDEL